MITQQQEHEVQEKAQVASPVQENQTAAPQEKPFGSTSTSSHRWRQVLLTIIAIALPFIAGSMVWWPWPGVPDMFDSEFSFYSVVLASIVSVFVGAVLLRSLWALLILPLAWIGGEFLTSIVRSLAEGGWAALQADPHFWDAQRTILFMSIERLFIWTGFGTILGIWLKERHQRQ